MLYHAKVLSRSVIITLLTELTRVSIFSGQTELKFYWPHDSGIISSKTNSREITKIPALQKNIKFYPNFYYHVVHLVVVSFIAGSEVLWSVWSRIYLNCKTNIIVQIYLCSCWPENSGWSVWLTRIVACYGLTPLVFRSWHKNP